MGDEHFGQLGLRKSAYALANTAGFENQDRPDGAVCTGAFVVNTNQEKKARCHVPSGPAEEIELGFSRGES